MKKIAFTLLLSITVIMAMAQSSGFILSGSFNDLTEGKVYIEKGANLIDSAQIQNGKFEFREHPVTDIEELYDLKVVGKNSGRLPFFTEKGRITINGNVEALEFDIVGTPNNVLLSEYFFGARPLNQEMRAIIKEAGEVYNAGDTTKGDFYGQKFMAVRDKFKEHNARSLEKYRDSVLGVMLLWEKSGSGSATAPYVDSLIALVPVTQQNSTYYRKMKETAVKLRTLDPGAQAPEFTLPSLAGEMMSLSSFKGKYVLLDFWASWCVPCRQETPNLIKAYNKYKADGFEIFSVSLDDKKAKWEKAIADDKMTWSQVSDLKGMKSIVAPLYSINGIPATWLLDKNGTIIAKNLRGEELGSKLKEIFGH